MRKLDLVNVGDELYEIVKRIPMGKFKVSIQGETATYLKQWARCDKILKSIQTNEYLFVNLIEEATIIQND
jgi:hypothetical protein